MRLPIKYPELTSYPELANELSIISAYNDAQEWIGSSYINIRMTFEKSRICRMTLIPNTKNNPIVVRQLFNTLFDGDEAVKKIEYMLDKECYCKVYVDRYYLRDYTMSGHLLHSFFIYGKTESSFLGADFIDKGKYIFTELDKNDYRCSVDTMSGLLIKPGISDMGKLTILQFNRKSKKLFDYRFLMEQLKNYVFSRDNTELTGIFGLKIYDTLANLYDEFDPRKWMDIRPLYVIRDHKRGMLIRWNYLCCKGYVQAEQGEIRRALEDVYNLADNCLYMALMYSYSKEKYLNRDLCNKLRLIPKYERVLYESIIDSLDVNKIERGDI